MYLNKSLYEAIYREAAEQAARDMRAKEDMREKEEAAHMFRYGVGLQEAIKTDILPALVSIRTQNGRVGTGFFQHSEWLVSNAHVAPCREILDVTDLVDYQLASFPLNVESSYHRPSDKNDSPDILIIKTNSRAVDNKKCLSTQFNEDEECAYRYIFYIDLNSADQYTVKYISRLSKENVYPIIYTCADGREPQPGCSGTPIIEARVAIGRLPQWQFKVVGALYASCSPSWSKPITNDINPNTRLVCAIPVVQEFLHILKIINSEEASDRAMNMAAACHALGDAQAIRDAQKYNKLSSENKIAKASHLQQFKKGDTALNISLPEDLEKLWYNEIVDISKSLLIEKILKKEIKKNSSKLFRIPSVSLEDLNADYQRLIETIRAKKNIKLQRGDCFFESTYFRVDVSGSNQTGWKLDIQDNTGKHHHNGNPLSSVFAIVTIPANITAIDGNQLAKYFEDSQANKSAQPFSLPVITQKETSRKSDQDKISKKR